MTAVGSGAIPATGGEAHHRPRRTRRVSALLTGVALLAVCGVSAALTQGSPSPVLRTVTVGALPYDSLTVDAPTGRAFVFNRGDNTLSVLDVRSGALLHTVAVGSGFAWMAVSAHSGHVFLASGGDGTISMLDARTGQVLRTVSDPDSDVRHLATDERDNVIFVGHRDSATVTVLDARTGLILRHLPVCAGPFQVGVSRRTDHLFAKCNDGTTELLDARSGRVLRRSAPNSGTYCAVYADEPANRVLEKGNDATDLVDAQSGQIIRRWPNDDCNAVAIDPVRGWIYWTFTRADRVPPPGQTRPVDEVAVLDGRTGAVLQRFPVPLNPLALAVDSRTGRLLLGSAGAADSAGVPTGNGMVSVLDGTSGRVLQTLSVGDTPTEIAVDGPARRALVVSSYTDVNRNDTAVSWRPRESWWPQVLRHLKQVVCCLPFQAPPPPRPTTDGTVTTLDLSRL